MKHTGTLRIQFGETALDGRLLAIKNGAPNPLAAATNFVQSQGFADGDPATVEGTEGTLGGVSVIFMTSISRPSGALVFTVTGKAKAKKKKKPVAKPKSKPKPASRKSPRPKHKRKPASKSPTGKRGRRRK